MGSSISPYNANMISYIKQTQITQRVKLTLFQKSGTKNYRNQQCSNNEGKFNLVTIMISIIDLLYTDWRGKTNAECLEHEQYFHLFFWLHKRRNYFLARIFRTRQEIKQYPIMPKLSSSWGRDLTSLFDLFWQLQWNHSYSTLLQIR